MKELSLSAWVDERAKRGLYIFTKADITRGMPNMKYDTVRISLHRLRESKRIISPWRNFYMAVPEEYALNGVVPQNLYIDAMMKFLGKDYYVCLLNAAALHGAAHQAVMTFSVMVSAPFLRSTKDGNMQTNFYSRKNIPMKYVVQRKTKTGYYNVSSPELTAMDLISQYKNVGGLNRVAVVMSELTEAMDISKLDDDLMSYYPMADVQRLGYLLDRILEEHDMADALYKRTNAKFQRAALKKSKSTDGAEWDEKWNLMINEIIVVEL